MAYAHRQRSVALWAKIQTAGSLREIYYLCVFAPLRLCVLFFQTARIAAGDLLPNSRISARDPLLKGHPYGSTFSEKSREKRIDGLCPGSLSNSEYKRTACSIGSVSNRWELAVRPNTLNAVAAASASIVVDAIAVQL